MDLNDAMGGLDFTAFGGGASTTAYSPAMPHDFNFNTAANAGDFTTVSPQEVLYASAPSSTAVSNLTTPLSTHLTTPSTFGESPNFDDNFEVSPNFGSSDFDNGHSDDPWFPLFPTAEPPANDALPSCEEAQIEIEEDLESLDIMEVAASSGSKSPGKKSATTSPTVGGQGRHSSVAGVNPRQRNKPLAPIVVDDPGDTVKMKRARNTLAARKSRARKAERLEELENLVAQLTQERDDWKEKYKALEKVSG
ncbi:bZIP transcription factor [Xylariomycetidae sp. FL0641]|nr:bZIP transcription factor [Xylariomycetidae sp. FL0641]